MVNNGVLPTLFIFSTIGASRVVKGEFKTHLRFNKPKGYNYDPSSVVFIKIMAILVEVK